MSFRHCAHRFAVVLRYRVLNRHMQCNYLALRGVIPAVNAQNTCVFHRNGLLKGYSSVSPSSGSLSEAEYERISNETLETLTDYFEELVEGCTHLKSPDIIFGDGVLTVQFGEPHGTYVINRQTPNLQIWLSSPTSGPKRYDFIDGHWIYRHDGVSLHDLLSEEISKIVKHTVDFKCCSFSSSLKK